MALVDKNSDKIPEGDYLELCDTIHELRQQVKPPSFLLDQNQPLWMGDEAPTYRPTLPVTDGQPRDWMDDELPSDLILLLRDHMNKFVNNGGILMKKFYTPVSTSFYKSCMRNGQQPIISDR